MNHRSYIVPMLKAGVSVAAIWWVSRTVRIEDVVSACASSNPLLILAAVAVFFITPILQGVRLKRLLDAQGIRLGLGEGIQLAFAGNFMNFAVPIGSTSGDVYKAAYLSQRTSNAWQVSATTFVDRLIGLATLLLSVTAIVWMSGGHGPLAPLRASSALLSAGLLTAAVVVRWMPTRYLDTSALSWLPARPLIAKMLRAARASVASRRVLALAIGDTLGIQIAATASFLLAAIALGFRLDPADSWSLYTYFSSGEIIKALPGPPQGIGTLEAAYGVFFRDWATPSQIVSAALAIRTINLICSLPGVGFVIRHASDRGLALTETYDTNLGSLS